MLLRVQLLTNNVKVFDWVGRGTSRCLSYEYSCEAEDTVNLYNMLAHVGSGCLHRMGFHREISGIGYAAFALPCLRLPFHPLDLFLGVPTLSFRRVMNHP